MEKKLIVFVSRPGCYFCDELTKKIKDENVENKWEEVNCKLIILRTDNENEIKKYEDQLNITLPNYVPYLHCMVVKETNKNNQILSNMKSKQEQEQGIIYEVVYQGFEITDQGRVTNIDRGILSELESAKKSAEKSAKKSAKKSAMPTVQLRFGKKYMKYKLKYLSIKD